MLLGQGGVRSNKLALMPGANVMPTLRAQSPQSSPLRRSSAASCTHSPGAPSASPSCEAVSHDWKRATSGWLR